MTCSHLNIIPVGTFGDNEKAFCDDCGMIFPGEVFDPVRDGHFREARSVCLRLVDGPQDGEWLVVPPVGPLRGFSWEAPADPASNAGVRMVQFVPTGALDWREDDCAEIWVPEDKLDLWRAEHDSEAL